MSTANRQYQVHLRGVQTMDAFAAAFNEGLINEAGGHWNGKSRDAFNDYLAWPVEEAYDLVLDGWTICKAPSERDLAIFDGILAGRLRRTLLPIDWLLTHPLWHFDAVYGWGRPSHCLH